MTAAKTEQDLDRQVTAGLRGASWDPALVPPI